MVGTAFFKKLPLVIWLKYIGLYSTVTQKGFHYSLKTESQNNVNSGYFSVDSTAGSLGDPGNSAVKKGNLGVSNEQVTLSSIQPVQLSLSEFRRVCLCHHYMHLSVQPDF